MATEQVGRSPVDNFSRNVFLNVPFDSDYVPLLHAIAFAVHDCGFQARCAAEKMDSGHNRLAKIFDIIQDCKFGIHDISRVELSAANQLPRFNMPFECGLFWGCLRFGDEFQRKKRLLVLDREANRYRGSLSDISGQDIGVHQDNPAKIIEAVRNFLSFSDGHRKLPGAEAIFQRYRLFQNELPEIAEAMEISREEMNKIDYFSDYVASVAYWLKQRELKTQKKS